MLTGGHTKAGDAPTTWAHWAKPMLLGWFVLLDVFQVFGRWLPNDAFGGNVQTYDAAARVWLAGGDPWAPTYATTFGPQTLIAPPPSLAPYLLTAGIPDGIATWIWVGLAAAAGLFAVRRLGLPWWWILFPPLLDDVFWGSAGTLGIAFVLAGPAWLAAVVNATFAPVLVAERRWSQLAIAAAVTAATLLVMPWGLFLSHLSEFSARAFVQSQGGTSAAGFVPLAIVTAAALVVLGWRRGWYLAVPALWPGSQVGYAIVSMPVLGALPLVAAAVAVPLPFVGPFAIIVATTWPRRRPAGSEESPAGSGVAPSRPARSAPASG